MIEWLPAVSAEVEKVATPEPLSVPVPSVVVPSRKVTVPVAVPGVLSDTVAVKVIEVPKVDGLTEVTTALVVLALFTVCVRIEELLPRKLLLPPYAAVIERLPPASNEVVNVATPFTSTVPVPSVAAPSINVTVPSGIRKLVSLTVAVKVTDCPKVDGFNEDSTVVVVGPGFITCASVVEVLG